MSTVNMYIEGSALDMQRKIRREGWLLIRAKPILQGFKILAIALPKEK